MSAKWTEGPWGVSVHNPWAFGYRPNAGHWDRIGVVDADQPNAAANLDLVLAAPDLYEALSNLVGHAEWVAAEFDIHWAHLPEARAALAKANGNETAER